MESRSPSPSPGVLEIVGVTPRQEAVYRFVLSSRIASPLAVAEALSATPEHSRAELEALRAHGLISRTGDGDAYFAVDPRVAMRALAERSFRQVDAVRASIPALAAAYERSQSEEDPHPRVRVVAGASSVGAWYGRLEQETTFEFLAFDRPPYVLAPHNPVQAGVIQRGVTWRAVYAAASLDRPGAWGEMRASVARGERARIAAELPTKLAISDRRIAMFSSALDSAHPEAVVTEAEPVVRLLCDLFEAVWDAAADVPADDEPVEPGVRGPSAEDRALLAMFAAGAKDAVIARELGMSPRTLRRRSSELLRRLGASNRFGAGVRAAQRGWI
jgi:DNA-binding CsgD family transcriptional regulator